MTSSLPNDPAHDAASGIAADLAEALHVAATDSAFSGVIRVDHGGTTVLEEGFGLADRAQEIAMTSGHRLGVASISKGFTALVIGTLIDEGALTLDSAVRPMLGVDLPLVDDAVTIGHLLSHTSGIGDYLDEDEGEITDHVLEVPVHTLEDAEDFLPVLADRVQESAPGERFAYNNAGFVLLALLAQRVAGEPFHESRAHEGLRAGGHDRVGLSPRGRARPERGARLPPRGGAAHQRAASAGARQR